MVTNLVLANTPSVSKKNKQEGYNESEQPSIQIVQISCTTFFFLTKGVCLRGQNLVRENVFDALLYSIN